MTGEKYFSISGYSHFSIAVINNILQFHEKALYFLNVKLWGKSESVIVWSVEFFIGGKKEVIIVLFAS